LKSQNQANFEDSYDLPVEKPSYFINAKLSNSKLLDSSFQRSTGLKIPGFAHDTHTEYARLQKKVNQSETSLFLKQQIDFATKAKHLQQQQDLTSAKTLNRTDLAEKKQEIEERNAVEQSKKEKFKIKLDA